MPVIPSGNISLLELLKFAFEQKHGNATVDPLEDHALVDSQWKSIHDAIKAHDIILYVESLDGTEKRLTDQHSDESLMWRTLLTGKLEHEPDPAVFRRTVYVRVDDASTFLKEFTGKGLDRPTDHARVSVARTSPVFIKTGGAGSAAEPPDTTAGGVDSTVEGPFKRTFLKTDIDADYTAWVKEQRTRTGRRPTFEADNEWRGNKGLTYAKLRELRKQHCTEKERIGGRPPRS